MEPKSIRMPVKDKIHQASILIVDDNPVNVTLMRKILENDGYSDIASTTNPVDVRALYRERLFDLILLDIHMPELSGFDVMAQLKQDFPKDYLPILVLSADQSEDARHLALSSGAKDFINKPFERLEVLLRVRNILEVRLLHKEVLEQNQQLEERVQERTKQLYDTQVNLIRCLGKAAEYRDNETGMHVIRMSETSAVLARQLGLDEHDCEIIRHASPMHDIGKIAIPDSILLKAGALTEEEWAVMKSHAQLGAEILSDQDSELLCTAALLARTHHERWDGSGYPEGLKGEEIPLFTRIVTVCDVFDALTSERPYKQAWPIDQALAYMKDKAGEAFDPNVVANFEQILPQVLEIRTLYSDNQTLSADIERRIQSQC